MINKFWFSLFLVVFLTFSLTNLTSAEADYETNVDNFVNNPTEKFSSYLLTKSGNLQYVLDNIVGKSEFSWNELKSAIEQNNEQVTIYLDQENSPSDFKIFKGIELKKLSIHTELENISILKADYLEHLESLSIYRVGDQLKDINLSDFNKLKNLLLDIDSNEKNNYNIKNLILPSSGSIERLYLSDVDINELTLSGLDNFESLYIEDSKIKNLNLKDITKLEQFELSFTNVENLHIENVNFDMGHFDFRIYDGMVKNFNINNISGLESLELDMTQIDSLSIKNAKDLYSVQAFIHQDDEIRMKNLTLSKLPDLEFIYLTNTLIEKPYFSDIPNLRELHIIESRISEMDLTNPTYSNLTNLSIHRSKLESVNLSKLKKLEKLDLADNQLTEIDLTGLKNLTELDISNNNISVLDLQDQEKLKVLFALGNKLTSLKFVEDVIDTLSVLFIDNNEINLKSQVNKPIHEKLKKQIIGYSLEWGPNYQFENQKVAQVDDSKLSDGKKSDDSKSTTDNNVQTRTEGKKGNVISQFVAKDKSTLRIHILDSKSRVIFPDDLPEDTVLEVSTIEFKEVEKMLEGTPYELAGDIFEFKLEDGVEINKPFKLELYFNKDKYPTDKWDVGIYYYNEETGEWELQESVIDTKNSIVYANVDHFSTYGVLAKPKQEVKGNVLPATATEYYNFMLIGFAFMMIGLISYTIYRRKTTN